MDSNGILELWLREISTIFSFFGDLTLINNPGSQYEWICMVGVLVSRVDALVNGKWSRQVGCGG